MTVLLPTDQVELHAAGEPDEHGWVPAPEPGSEPIWTGQASLQLINGLTAVRAAEDGGHGPLDPRSISVGTVYLPTDAPAADGLLLHAREQAFALSATRLVRDPVGSELDCLVASLSEVGRWPS